MKNFYAAGALGGLLLFTIQCGGSSVPQQKVSDSHASIRAAEEMGAQGGPQAALHLTLAREQVAKAEKLMKDGQDEEASRMLDRADADAELSLSLAREGAERKEASEAQDKIRDLRSRMGS